MGSIRRQTIFSSIVIYAGFIIGFINTYLYVKNGTFTTEQYGLVRLMNDLSITFFSFGTFGVISYIYKFHPFYKQNLSKKENDQAALSLLIISFGFMLIVFGSIMLKPLFIKKFIEKSSLLITYYYWILPYTFGILYFTILEAFAWFAQKSILTNFLKEAVIRVLQMVLILLFVFKLISFDLFIKLFSFIYILVTIVLLYHLLKTQSISINFKISRVTRKFYKKIFTLMALIYGSLIVNTLAQYIDSIIIASVSKAGLSDVGVYTLAGFIATTIMVPQRSVVAATIPTLSASWKNKNFGEIQRIYSRSSINLLMIALFIFCLIWLNLDDAFDVLNINKNYEAGKMAILLLSLKNIIDAGTGVNSQIIGTSNFWRFEVITGIFLLSISIPLNYILVKQMGIDGSALSTLIAYTIYNIIRLMFIWKKFKMQPFTFSTLYIILTAVILYFICYFVFNSYAGWAAIIIRSSVFTLLFAVIVIRLKISPDVLQVSNSILGRFKSKKEIN